MQVNSLKKRKVFTAGDGGEEWGKTGKKQGSARAERAVIWVTKTGSKAGQKRKNSDKTERPDGPKFENFE